MGCLALAAACGESKKTGSGESGGGTAAATEGKPGASATADGTSPGAIDPCAMFSADEAQALLGAPVNPPMRQEPVPGTIVSCSYAEKDGPAVIQVVLKSSSRTGTIETELAETEKAMGQKLVTQKTTVGGVEATWVEGQDLLHAAKGGWNVTTSTSKKGDKLGISKALMEKVLPRLPPGSP